MDKNNNTPLAKYLASAAAVLGTTAAQAQYIYTDVDDTTIVNGIYELDLDGDTIVDFTIEHILGGGQLGNVNAILLHPGDSIEGNLAMGSVANGFAYVERVVPGTTIDAMAQFQGINSSTGVGYMAFRVDGQAYPNSNWAGPLTDGYLGLRIMKDDTACYGWARIDVQDSAKSFTIKDWSFNPTKDSAHTAAFELLDIMQTVLSNLDIRNGAGTLEIFTGQALRSEIFNAAGQKMSEMDPRSAHRYTTTGWSTGMYVIKISGENWFHNVKVWIP
jgi:hypothetical protein